MTNRGGVTTHARLKLIRFTTARSLLIAVQLLVMTQVFKGRSTAATNGIFSRVPDQDANPQFPHSFKRGNHD